MLSLIAITFSTISLVLYFITIVDYPHTDLDFNPLSKDKHEIQCIIENHGHIKLKLILAFYLIENKNPDASSQDFFQFTGKSWEFDFRNLADELEKNKEEIEIYSLNIAHKETGVFLSYNEKHVESRIYNFKPSRLYRITFYILTKRMIVYYISKYRIF